MGKVVVVVATLLMVAGGLAQASEKDVRAYCEDAAKVMQLEGEKAAAYIAECVKEKLAEEGDE